MPGGAKAHLLELQNVRTELQLRDGVLTAVDCVSFHVDSGETLGIVGESGSGKTMTALSILRLLPRSGRVTNGQVRFKGRDLLALSEGEMEEIRGAEIAMIFQDPMTSLNPVFEVGWQVGEPLRLHRATGGRESMSKAVEMFSRVGIPEAARRVSQYPHMFSGGMRQRAMIAMGLSTEPSLLIADEPTTALDVTIQAQILELLRTLNREFGTATILITHNLGVVAGMCERVVVMYAGRVVEQGPTRDVFAHPQHPYTWSLLHSIPRLDDESGKPLRPVEGAPPDMLQLPPGCKFNPRCPFAIEQCSKEEPELLPVKGAQLARCWVTQAGDELTEPGA
ncbi:MAG: ABC transporter ATP-binding protein [Chloroflexi bacterium]|nr:MAG: ABC transporter ATP-binding protein [Chloroflexota bacterium]